MFFFFLLVFFFLLNVLFYDFCFFLNFSIQLFVSFHWITCHSVCLSVLYFIFLFSQYFANHAKTCLGRFHDYRRWKIYNRGYNVIYTYWYANWQYYFGFIKPRFWYWFQNNTSLINQMKANKVFLTRSAIIIQNANWL